MKAVLKVVLEERERLRRVGVIGCNILGRNVLGRAGGAQKWVRTVRLVRIEGGVLVKVLDQAL